MAKRESGMTPVGRPRYKAPSGKASVKGDMWMDDGATPHNGRMPNGNRFPSSSPSKHGKKK